MRGRSTAPTAAPDVTKAVPGMPNTSLDLEAFTATAYAALKRALADEPGLMAAIERLFPQMGLREKLTLRWLAIPRGKDAIAKLQASIDRPLPFPNGVPGSTNGVAALKHQLHVTARDRFNDGAGFVSVPVLADRFWRSALLADGAYVAKGQPRFRAVAGEEAKARDPRELAAIASFFMVPSMGMSDVRVAAAIPELTEVMRWLRDFSAPPYPGPIDRSLAAVGRDVYARACATCHGSYDASIERPRLQSFPNWAGDVGTDRSRVEAFTPALTDAVRATLHGRSYLDAASTGKDRGAAPVRRLGKRALFRERLGADDPPPARARDPPGSLHGRRAPARSRPARYRRNRDARRQLGLSGRLLAVLDARHDRHDEAGLLQRRDTRLRSAASRPRIATR